MTDMKPGSRWLLPVTYMLTLSHYAREFETVSGPLIISHEECESLIPADRITELEGEVTRLREALQSAKSFIEERHAETGVCCCGDYVDDHSGYEDHSPVDSGFYAAHMAAKEIDHALNPAPDEREAG